MWIIDTQKLEDVVFYCIGWLDRSNKFHTFEASNDWNYAVNLCSKLNGGN